MNKYCTLLALAAAFFVTQQAAAQFNIFVKIMDQNNALIKGNATNPNYVNQIEANGFGQENTSCSTNSPTGSGGACAGKVGHFILNMPMNPAVPLLNQALFTGSLMKTVDIQFTTKVGTAAPFQYYTIHLLSVYITHVTNSNDNTNAGTVQVELDAAKVTWTYTPQTAPGTPGAPIMFGWNVLTNSIF